MEVVLSGLARRVCVVYLDDVLVFGRTIAEHNANLTQVMGRLRRAGLRLKPKKCRFALTEVEYLGHVVSAQGIRTDPKKVAAMEQFPIPQDIKTLRSFLGLASYYRKFVAGFAKVAGPLHALTKKDVPFLWTPSCQKAFSELKALLTNSSLLVFRISQSHLYWRRMLREQDLVLCWLRSRRMAQHALLLMLADLFSLTRRITESPNWKVLVWCGQLSIFVRTSMATLARYTPTILP